MHVHLDYHAHVVAGGFHDLLHHELHEAHAVLEAASELVAAVVGVGREELADQVAVAGVDLHAVESGLAGEVHGMAEVVGDAEYLVLAQSAHEGGGVEVEAGRGPDGGAAAGGAVGHVAAVAELYGGLGALGVDCIGEFAELGHYLLTHPELGVEGESRTRHRGVGHGGHPHAAVCDCGVVVEQVLRRTVVVCHVLEGG